jgi:hypothetical protein
MTLLNKCTLCLATFLFSLQLNAGGLDLKKLGDMLKEKAQQAGQNNNQQNKASPSTTSTAPQTNTSSTSSNQSSSNNNFQSANDPSRESVKKQKEIIQARRAGVPVEVKAVADGQERITKDEVLVDALTKAVAMVHPDFNLNVTTQYYKTKSEFQNNITKPEYGVIKSFERTDKENIYAVMGQADPSKNTWSVTTKALVNTKLTPENIKKISDDQRVIYTVGFGANADEAKQKAALAAVQYYHQVEIEPNSVFAKSILKSNYGVIQKFDVLNESTDQYTKLIFVKAKVSLNDVGTLDKNKFNSIKNDIEISKVKKAPNPIITAFMENIKEVNAAQAILENALNIKGNAELVKKDAVKEKMGVRFADNGFQRGISMTQDRYDAIEERLKDNPKLDEQQKKEYERGPKALIAPALNTVKIFLSAFGSGNPFQGLEAFIVAPRYLAMNSEAINTLATYNSNNGIDNTAMNDAKNSLGD